MVTDPKQTKYSALQKLGVVKYECIRKMGGGGGGGGAG